MFNILTFMSLGELVVSLVFLLSAGVLVGRKHFGCAVIAFGLFLIVIKS